MIQVQAMGVILSTKYDPNGKARIFEVEGSRTNKYESYSLNDGSGNKALGLNGFTLHHDFGSDLSFFDSVRKNLTRRYLRFCVVSYILMDLDTRVTHT
jgi:hypothetical protein